MVGQQLFDNPLYLITDRHQILEGKSLTGTIEQALQGGIRLIQLREKDLPAAELLPLARDLRQLTHHYSAKLIINDRIDVALACDADGVHLGGHSLPTNAARKLIGPDLLLGVSTHSINDILQATRQGADFLTFGPVYQTPSKALFGPPQGLEMLEQACRQTKLPVFALGGIKADHVHEVMSHGASGIALISAILTSADPRETTRYFLKKLF